MSSSKGPEFQNLNFPETDPPMKTPESADPPCISQRSPQLGPPQIFTAQYYRGGKA